MAPVFVSYANEDYDRVLILVRCLKAAGVPIFWDRVIPPGLRWRDVLDGELASAQCVVAVWSKISVNSNWVREEAHDGQSRGILVPVLIDPVTPPIGFREVHASNLSTWSGQHDDPSFLQLLDAVERRVRGPRHVDFVPTLTGAEPVVPTDPFPPLHSPFSISPVSASVPARARRVLHLQRTLQWSILSLSAAGIASLAIRHWGPRKGEAPFQASLANATVEPGMLPSDEHAPSLSPTEKGGVSAVASPASASVTTPPASSHRPRSRPAPKVQQIKIDPTNPY